MCCEFQQARHTAGAQISRGRARWWLLQVVWSRPQSPVPNLLWQNLRWALALSAPREGLWVCSTLQAPCVCVGRGGGRWERLELKPYALLVPLPSKRTLCVQEEGPAMAPSECSCGLQPAFPQVQELQVLLSLRTSAVCPLLSGLQLPACSVEAQGQDALDPHSQECVDNVAHMQPLAWDTHTAPCGPWGRAADTGSVGDTDASVCQPRGNSPTPGLPDAPPKPHGGPGLPAVMSWRGRGAGVTTARFIPPEKHLGPRV